MRRAWVIAALIGAGCRGGHGRNADSVSTCDDVGAAAMKVYVEPVTRASRAPDGLLASPPPPPPEDPRTSRERERDRWRLECVRTPWSQPQIDCFAAVTDMDDEYDCLDASPFPEPEDRDLACVEAAEHGAIILVNDAHDNLDLDTRAEARAAILRPCLAHRFPAALLACLSNPDKITSFKTCGTGLGRDRDWRALAASVERAGFSAR